MRRLACLLVFGVEGGAFCQSAASQLPPPVSLHDGLTHFHRGCDAAQNRPGVSRSFLWGGIPSTSFLCDECSSFLRFIFYLIDCFIHSLQSCIFLASVGVLDISNTKVLFWTFWINLGQFLSISDL